MSQYSFNAFAKSEAMAYLHLGVFVAINCVVGGDEGSGFVRVSIFGGDHELMLRAHMSFLSNDLALTALAGSLNYVKLARL